MSRSTQHTACNSLATPISTRISVDIGTRLSRPLVSVTAVLAVTRLTSSALRAYSPRIVKHYKLLMDIFTTGAATGTPMDVSTRFMDLFFDVVSDLTFGESFNTLTKGERNPVVGEFLQHQTVVGFVLLNMWIFHLLRSIPAVAARLLYMMRWYASAISRRKEVRERSSRKRQWYANALKQRKQVR